MYTRPDDTKRTAHRMPDRPLVLEGSSCSICLEDCDATKLQPPLSDAERSEHGGGADGNSICLYSVLKARYDAGTYEKEVVAVHDVVQGTQVPRCWLHAEEYEPWKLFVMTGRLHRCPMCNRGVVVDANNQVFVYDEATVNVRLVAAALLLGHHDTHRWVTPLFMAAEAGSYKSVEYLLTNPELLVDCMSIVDGKYVTATRCAAVAGHWLVVKLLLTHRATYDKVMQPGYFYIHTTTASSSSTPAQGPPLHLHTGVREVSSVMTLAAQAGEWYVVLLLLDCPSHVGLAGLQCVLQCTSTHSSVFGLAVRAGEWAVVEKMIDIYMHEVATFGEQGGAEHRHLVLVGEEVLFSRDAEGYSVLGAAADQQWSVIRKALRCALLHARVWMDSDYHELFYTAAFAREWDVVETMLHFKGAYTLVPDPSDCSQDLTHTSKVSGPDAARVVWMATEDREWRVVLLLIQRGFDPRLFGAGGGTPVLMAAADDAWAVVDAVLDYAGHHMPGHIQTTSREVASRVVNLAFDASDAASDNSLQALLRHNRKSFALASVLGAGIDNKTLIMFAALSGRWGHVLRLVLGFSADPCSRTNDSRNLLELAVAQQQWHVALLLWHCMGHTQKTGKCFLVTCAASHQRWDLVVAMVRGGYRLPQKTTRMLLPTACAGGAWKVVFWLIFRGAQPTAGLTRAAIQQGEFWIVPFLCRHGAKRIPYTEELEHAGGRVSRTGLPDADAQIQSALALHRPAAA